MRKQKMVQTYACLDSDLIAGYPPNTFNGEAIRDDSICEVMNTVTREIYKIYKMETGQWYEYMVGESAVPETQYVEWIGYPQTPAACPTATYPHQIIVDWENAGTPVLLCSTQQIVYNWGTPGYLDTYPDTGEVVRGFLLSGGAWITGMDQNLNEPFPDQPVLKSNRDIINLQTGAVVYPKAL